MRLFSSSALLVDEPLQEDVGRVVAFLQGQLVQAVYTGRDLLLVFKRHPHHRRYGLELHRRLPDGLEHNAAPSAGDEVEQLQSMGAKCRSTRPMQNIAPIATSHKKKAVPLN